MALTGLILLLAYLLPIIQEKTRFFDWQININSILPVLLLLLVACVACLIVIQRVLSDDDLTYLAYVTNWQNSIHLDFNEIIFGTSNLTHPRFWLLSAPFAQALLADIVQIPAIFLFSGYYEPFLVIIAVLCWYELMVSLGLSHWEASGASIIQIVFLLFLSEYLHPGAPFFNQLGTDKATAAFIMAPVFFQSMVRLIKQPKKNNFILLIFTGLSLSLMHPVILAYSIFIGGMLVLLNWKNTRIAEKLITILMLVIILLPQIVLRFVNIPSQVEIPYTSEALLSQRGVENMISVWGDTQFYGFNPDILDMNIPYEENIPISQSIKQRGWLIFPFISAIFSLLKKKKSFVAHFILATFLLGLLAGIPFTGWIIGYFLSAYMLERALWLFPFGLSVVFTFSILYNYLKSKSLSSNWLLTTITAIAIGSFILYLRENNMPDFEKFAMKSQRYQDISTAGLELNNQIIDKAYVIGSPNLNDLIPGISSKSKLITYRISDPSNMSYYTIDERNERISDSKKLFSRSASAESKMDLIKKYNIRFLFITPFDLQLFDELIENYPNKIQPIEVGGVIIIRINY